MNAQVLVKPSFKQRYENFMPPGAGVLFCIQIFATLGFSVLYSTLILYATHGLHLDDHYATSITGSFVALNYFLHLLGGYVGGRHLSYRSLFSIGMLAQVIGCALISIPSLNFLLWGLTFFLTGCGLNVTCINCMVTQLFEPDDKRREAAFLWNYSGMNIGFFIGFSMSGYLHLQHAYHQLFLLSAFGNLIALILVFRKWNMLGDRKTTYIELSAALRKRAQVIGCMIVVALAISLRFLLEHTTFCNNLILVIGASMIGVLYMIMFRQQSAESRGKIQAYIILCLSAVIFWTLFQLAPMGLNLFIDRNVDRHFWGILIAPQWVQNVNTLVIIFGGPIMSIVFSNLRERGFNITIPLQFSIALLLIGAGFAILPIGISFANAQGLSNFNWILACYILQSLGELFISPIGYAMIGQLAPIHHRGLMMGTWMMVTGVAAILSDFFSKMALGSTASTDPLITNPSFSQTFGILGWSAIVVGVMLAILIPVLTRLTNEKKTVLKTPALNQV